MSKIIKELLPFIIICMIWIFPVTMPIRIILTLLIGIDIQRTYFPVTKEENDTKDEDDKGENV